MKFITHIEGFSQYERNVFVCSTGDCNFSSIFWHWIETPSTLYMCHRFCRLRTLITCIILTAYSLWRKYVGTYSITMILNRIISFWYHVVFFINLKIPHQRKINPAKSAATLSLHILKIMFLGKEYEFHVF